MSVSAEVRIHIASEADIVTARQLGRKLAADGGFSSTDQTLIATAISELARNIVEYARHGEITLSALERQGHRGVKVIARDEGPGIADIRLAMQDGYSTGNSLGMGLPGVRRLMDDFDLVSTPGKGTTVTLHKWTA
jgi:serine/threonine-protein kinase RsbT